MLPEDDRRESTSEEYVALSERLDDHQARMAELRSGARGISDDDAMVEDHLRELGYLE